MSKDMNDYRQGDTIYILLKKMAHPINQGD